MHDNAVIYANAMHEYDVGMIWPLLCHEDTIKEYARVSLLCAPYLRNLMERIQESPFSDNSQWFHFTLLASRDIILLGNTLWR